MKFTDGYWQLRPGVSVLRPARVDSVEPDERGFTVFAPTGQITGRGDTLNRPVVTVRFFSPRRRRHRREHRPPPRRAAPASRAFALATGDDHPVAVDVTGASARR